MSQRIIFNLIACLLMAVLGILPGGPVIADESGNPNSTGDMPPEFEELASEIASSVGILDGDELWMQGQIEVSEAQCLTITRDDLVDPRMCMVDLSDIDGDIEFSNDLGEVFIGGDGIACTGALFVRSGTELTVYRDLHVGQHVISAGTITVRGNLSIGDPEEDSGHGSILVQHGDLKCYGELLCDGFVHLSNGSLEAVTIQTGSADVSGAIAASGDCFAKGNLTGGYIIIEGNLTAGGDVLALRRMMISGYVDVEGCLACGAGYLQVDGDIHCGNSISAGISIETDGVIDCKGTISSGTVAITYRPECYGSISCRELMSGEIIMGELVETGENPENPPS